MFFDKNKNKIVLFDEDEFVKKVLEHMKNDNFI